MLRRIFTLATMLISVALSLQPQTTLQEQDARMHVAMRLAHVLNPPEAYRERMRTMYASMTPMFAQAAQQGVLPQDFPDRMTKVMEEVLPYDEFTRFFAEQYADHFTVDELTEMTRFYSSPTGAKMLSSQTEIGVALMKKVSIEIMPKMQDAMRKQGLVK
jgi:hypothetical protein